MPTIREELTLIRNNSLVRYDADRVCQFFRRDVSVDYALPTPSDPPAKE
jgi:hypothetical protein